MSGLRSWLRPGRSQRLRLFLYALTLASAAYLVVNLANVSRHYHEAGSLHMLWHREWRGGDVLTGLLGEGLFQFFVLVLGWSSFFRLRTGELAQLRLRRSEAKYRNIINHAGEAVFLLDEDGRVQEWNKMAEQLFRVPRRNALGHGIEQLDLGLQRPSDLRVEQVFGDVRRTGRSLTYEVLVGREGGPSATQRTINLTVSAIRADAGPLGDEAGAFVVIARDITSEKQLETRMGETEKLAGIGQLAAGIAHQLNTPLGSILLSAQMLEDSTCDEDQADDVRRIIRQTEQCRGIIKGLLNFARPTGSERSRMNLMEPIEETVFLMEKNLTVAGVEAVVQAEGEPWVYGNRNELSQVFFNLMANALDAMPNGGRIAITVTPVEPGELLITFADTGEGIPAEHQENVFLPFFTTKDYGKGTGLGLSIVARIVHEHGGRIELDSTPGKGTIFRLWLPRAREGAARTALLDDDA
ncbi:MAG TPA: ATP-binding protein [Candidatus Krumholzibacteria bacterium]|nr:ATP-binding protein [Candidatus Krumholzibacteria bacterium]